MAALSPPSAPCEDDDEALRAELRGMVPPLPGLDLSEDINGLDCATLPFADEQCGLFACPKGLCCASCGCNDAPPSPPALPGGCLGDNEFLLGKIAKQLQNVQLPGQPAVPPLPPGPPVTCSYIESTDNCAAFCEYADFVCCETCNCTLAADRGGGDFVGDSILGQEAGDEDEFPLWIILLIVGLVFLVLLCWAFALMGGSSGVTRWLRTHFWYGAEPPPPELAFAQGTVEERPEGFKADGNADGNATPRIQDLRASIASIGRASRASATSGRRVSLAEQRVSLVEP